MIKGNVIKYAALYSMPTGSVSDLGCEIVSAGPVPHRDVRLAHLGALWSPLGLQGQ